MVQAIEALSVGHGVEGRLHERGRRRSLRGSLVCAHGERRGRSGNSLVKRQDGRGAKADVLPEGRSIPRSAVARTYRMRRRARGARRSWSHDVMATRYSKWHSRRSRDDMCPARGRCSGWVRRVFRRAGGSAGRGSSRRPGPRRRPRCRGSNPRWTMPSLRTSCPAPRRRHTSPKDRNGSSRRRPLAPPGAGCPPWHWQCRGRRRAATWPIW